MTYKQLLNLVHESSKRISYSAVVLDEVSRAKILGISEIMDRVGPDHEIIAHHMTIKMGGLSGTRHQDRLGRTETLLATHVGSTPDGNVVAIKVRGDSDNKTPHVTISVNRKRGAKPVMSNNITEWTPLSEPVQLNGKVEEL